jgi:hypothetical protein
MFSPNGRGQGLAEPIRLLVSAHQRGGGENRRAAAGATSLNNPNARQGASYAIAVVVDRIVVGRRQAMSQACAFSSPFQGGGVERYGDFTPIRLGERWPTHADRSSRSDLLCDRSWYPKHKLRWCFRTQYMHECHPVQAQYQATVGRK